MALTKAEILERAKAQRAGHRGRGRGRGRGSSSVSSSGRIPESKPESSRGRGRGRGRERGRGRGRGRSRGDQSSTPKQPVPRTTNASKTRTKPASTPGPLRRSTRTATAKHSDEDGDDEIYSEPESSYPYVLIITPASSTGPKKKQPAKQKAMAKSAAANRNEGMTDIPAGSGSTIAVGNSEDARVPPDETSVDNTDSVAECATIVFNDGSSPDMSSTEFKISVANVLEPTEQDAEMADLHPVETVAGGLASVLADALSGTSITHDESEQPTWKNTADPDPAEPSNGIPTLESTDDAVNASEIWSETIELSNPSSMTTEQKDAGSEPMEQAAECADTASTITSTDMADTPKELAGPADIAQEPTDTAEELVDQDDISSKHMGQDVEMSESPPANAMTDDPTAEKEPDTLTEQTQEWADLSEESSKHDIAEPKPEAEVVDQGDEMEVDKRTDTANVLSSIAEAPQSLESICQLLPDPQTLCDSSFDHFFVSASVLEPAHVLVSPRREKTHIQAIYEYKMESFPVAQDPGPWRRFQEKKYAMWASMYDSCQSVQVHLIPQTTSCMAKNEFKQPQCRACIGRVAGKGCRFAMVRYITKLTITMADGREVCRYLPCPVFRSEISKENEVRQPITPIELPSSTVVRGDNDSWTEFHMLCQTASAMKSLLRRELAIVRELSPHATHSDLHGTIRFHDTAEIPGDGDISPAVHPLYACSPSPCVLRKVPMGAHQRCDQCAAPIFSVYFSCCMCMQEICAKCFLAWDDADVVQHSYKIERGTKTPVTQDDAQLGQTKDISYCKRFATKDGEKIVHFIERHTKMQFVRVSHYTEGELEMMLRKVNRIVQYCDHLDITQPSSYSSISLCANELPLEEPELRTDRSWMDEVLDSVDMDTEVIASLGDADFGGRPEHYSRESEMSRRYLTPGAGPSRSQSAFLESAWDSRQRTLLHPKYPLKGWQKTPVYVGAEELTLREFARLWEEDYVIVVTGLTDIAMTTSWSPDVLLKRVSKQPTTVHLMGTTRTTPIGDMTVAGFLKTKPPAKLKSDKSYRSIFKVAPPTSTADDKKDTEAANFYEVLEEMVQEVQELLPFPQYTTPNGKLNLVNRLPLQYKQPELPMEVHMVQLATDPNVKNPGRENLRYDIADTFDLLAYASEPSAKAEPATPTATKRRGRAAKAKPAVVEDSPEPPRRRSRPPRAQPDSEPHDMPIPEPSTPSAVIWDIYPFDLQEQLCHFLGDSDDGPADTDLIITQRKFMNDRQCAEFFADYEDACAIRVYQNPGDLVMVPSGFTYQRQTTRDTVSVRGKFLSPEHASYARNVSDDVTKRGNARRHEALPVMDILWWAWLGCSDRGEASAGDFISKSRKHHISKGAPTAVQASPAKRARTGAKKQTS